MALGPAVPGHRLMLADRDPDHLQAAVDGHRSFLTAYDETAFKFGSYTTSTQAIAAAEQQAGGRASKAEYEHSKQHGWVYDVEVVAGAKVFDVKVDAQNGAVLASALDSEDHDDGHDARD